MTRGKKIVPTVVQDEPAAQCKYRPEYCQAVRDMAQEGMFPEEWCARIGVTMMTLYRWANRFPEFEEAVEVSWHILHAYYAEQFRRASKNKEDRSIPSLLEIMRKRFPETWGNNPRNTLEAFQRRNQDLDHEYRPGDDARDVTSAPEGGGASTPGASGADPREELEERVQALLQRRMHDDGAGKK